MRTPEALAAAQDQPATRPRRGKFRVRRRPSRDGEPPPPTAGRDYTRTRVQMMEHEAHYGDPAPPPEWTDTDGSL